MKLITVHVEIEKDLADQISQNEDVIIGIVQQIDCSATEPDRLFVRSIQIADLLYHLIVIICYEIVVF